MQRLRGRKEQRRRGHLVSQLAICKEVGRGVVGGDVEPIRKLLLAQQRDLNFILYIWSEMLKDFHQVGEIIGSTF